MWKKIAPYQSEALPHVTPKQSQDFSVEVFSGQFLLNKKLVVL